MKDPYKIIGTVFKTKMKQEKMPIRMNGTREILARCFRHLGYVEGVEVGTRRGNYAMVLCRENPSLHLTCVDPWIPYRRVTQEAQDKYYDCAVKNLAPFNIDIIKKSSMKAVKSFAEGSLDFVFVDGEHTFDHAAPDIIRWSAKVRSGGMVAVHDYYEVGRTYIGVTLAVQAYTDSHNIRPWFVTTTERTPTAFWLKP